MGTPDGQQDEHEAAADHPAHHHHALPETPQAAEDPAQAAADGLAHPAHHHHALPDTPQAAEDPAHPAHHHHALQGTPQVVADGPAPGTAGWLPSGVMAALATPMDSGGELDRAGLDRLLDHVLANPVTGVAPVGTTGEGPLLSREDRVTITSQVARRVAAGTAVIPAAVATTAGDVQADIEAYAEAGAHAVLVGTPFYYPMGAAAVARWFSGVAERSPLPLLLYHIPPMTKVHIPPEVAGELAAHPRIVGMKDSSRDFEYFQLVLAAADGQPFSLLTGSDTLLLASGVLGGAGTIAASVNLVPDLVTALWAEIRTGELEQARSLQRRLQAVIEAVRRAGGPPGWKAALEAAGICQGRGANPNTGIEEATRLRLRDDLGRLGVLATAAS